MESIIFFVLALMVWGLLVGARWMKEQMDKASYEGAPIEWSSRSALELSPAEETLVLGQEQQSPTPVSTDRSRMSRPKKNFRRRLGLENPQNLRQGIILMTVLGPCRALEQPNNSKPF
ncbi:MAG: hypothetical protein ACE1ZO_05440 [Nitrospirales bacterium]